MDILGRRNHLSLQDNPDSHIDYVTSLSGEVNLAAVDKPLLLQLRYVPDRVILEPASFIAYLAHLSVQDWDSLERLATTILDDMNNELVARWVQVTIDSGSATDGAPRHHRVFLQDSQPNWNNAELLNRLDGATAGER
jgi:7-cyano-7-deazaguanine reductase